MTRCSYPKGHDSLSSITKNGQELLKNMFLAIFISVTFYSTHNIDLWANDITQGTTNTYD
jgi:hypothetical protein